MPSFSNPTVTFTVIRRIGRTNIDSTELITTLAWVKASQTSFVSIVLLGRISRIFAFISSVVLCAEQYTKSFEFKSKLSMIEFPTEPTDEHGERLARFALLLILPHFMTVGAFNFLGQLTNPPVSVEPNRDFMRKMFKLFTVDARKTC